MTFDELMAKIEAAWTELEDEIISTLPSPALPGMRAYRPHFPICFTASDSELHGIYPQAALFSSPKGTNMTVGGWIFTLGTPTRRGTVLWAEIAPHLDTLMRLAQIAVDERSVHYLSFPLAHNSGVPGRREIIATETLAQANSWFLRFNVRKSLAMMWPERHELIGHSILNSGNALPDADYVNPYAPEYLQ